jgi:DNA helicase-2/ATP-dependent DNA helicase PcrA
MCVKSQGKYRLLNHVYASRSRFIPETLVPLFERTTWPKPVAGAARTAALGPKVDIGARMRGMWR